MGERVIALCRHSVTTGYPQVQALQALGLDIRRAKVTDAQQGSKFYITDAATSEKIMKSAKLEEIRLTVLNNMLHYHPESAE